MPTTRVIGKKESEDRTVSIRRIGSPDTKVMKLEELINSLQTESLSPIE